MDDTKHCSACDQDLPRSAFMRLTRRSGNELSAKCKKCDAERSKADRLKLRLELLTRYSVGSTPSCELCGESRIMVLELDHRHGGGRRHRASYSDIYSYYRAIRNDGFADVLRVLCRNCNWIEYRKGE